MKLVIWDTAQDSVRNETLFRLARMYFQKDRPVDARHTFEHIRGDVPAAVRSDLAFLRANIDMAVGLNADAVAILKELQREEPGRIQLL